MQAIFLKEIVDKKPLWEVRLMATLEDRKSGPIED